MRISNSCLVVATALCMVSSLQARAQVADNNPACGKDPQRGIVCAGHPPLVAPFVRPFSLAVANQSGLFDGMQGSVRYDRDLRGTDHLAHALFSFGRVSNGADERNVVRAEIMTTISAGRSLRAVGGFRHLSNAAISHPFTLITGVRAGRAAQHLSATLESGVIKNRNSGDGGFETTFALSGYRSIPRLLEVDAALRIGMGWGAGGAVSGLDVGVTRRIGSTIKVRGEWSNARLSGREGDQAATDRQIRVSLSAAVFGGRRVLRPALPGSGQEQVAPSADNGFVPPQERDQHLARAQVLVDTNVAQKDVFKGPPDPGAFNFREEVQCTFDPDTELGGNTPKFACTDNKGVSLKVKYGCDNGEVFGEVAATRLLWLLGFEADHMYPVVVKCKDCPPELPFITPAERETGRFECATIERKTGEAIESFKDQGWSWAELDRVSEAAGGATRAQIDALKLLAVLMQHNDSKDNNQRIICDRNGWSATESSEKRTCMKPTIVVQDAGSTFGGAGNRVRPDSKMDLDHWREQMIWLDGRRCIANLAGSMKDGTILDPHISEAGRALLANQLQKVSAEQVHDLFRVAQVELHDPGATGADWERAFWYKAWQVVNHSCTIK